MWKFSRQPLPRCQGYGLILPSPCSCVCARGFPFGVHRAALEEGRQHRHTSVPAAQETAPGRYRYLVILIGFVTLAGASGVSSSFQVFYHRLLAEFDWSHASGASPYAVNQLVLAASAAVPAADIA